MKKPEQKLTTRQRLEAEIAGELNAIEAHDLLLEALRPYDGQKLTRRILKPLAKLFPDVRWGETYSWLELYFTYKGEELKFQLYYYSVGIFYVGRYDRDHYYSEPRNFGFLDQNARHGGAARQRNAERQAILATSWPERFDERVNAIDDARAEYEAVLEEIDSTVVSCYNYKWEDK